MEPALFHCHEQAGPVLLNFPHSGVFVPDDIAANLNQQGRALTDTDWHVPQLYEPVKAQASWLQATHSRYVVDLNRDPDGAELYPGQAGTEVCPVTDFAGNQIYQSGYHPQPASRIAKYFAPYHGKLQTQIKRIRQMHGFCILLDCHSIRVRVPRLFDGQLPELNLGTFVGKSCDATLAAMAEQALSGQGFSFVRDGRFQGGWITRTFGQPQSNVHALQLEIAQCCYMDEDNPHKFDAKRAAPLQNVLSGLVLALQEWAANTGNPTR